MSGIISDNLSKSSGLIKSASVSVDYVKLATYATSGAESELVCDGDFSSDYKHYLYFFNYIYPSNSSNAAHFYMRYRSGGSTLTGSNWKISNSGGYNDLNGSQSSNVWDPGYNNSAAIMHMGQWGSDQVTGLTGHMYLYDPLNTVNYKRYSAFFGFQREDEDTMKNTWSCGTYNTGQGTALSGITLYASTGNITANVTMYGIK